DHRSPPFRSGWTCSGDSPCHLARCVNGANLNSFLMYLSPQYVAVTPSAGHPLRFGNVRQANSFVRFVVCCGCSMASALSLAEVREPLSNPARRIETREAVQTDVALWTRDPDS